MPMSDIERRDKSSGRQFISMAWCGAEYYGGNHGWGVSCSLCLPVKGWTCLRVHLSGLFYFELLIDIEIFEKCRSMPKLTVRTLRNNPFTTSMARQTQPISNTYGREISVILVKSDRLFLT